MIKFIGRCRVTFIARYIFITSIKLLLIAVLLKCREKENKMMDTRSLANWFPVSKKEISFHE